jgi:two-component system, NarL family, invasion response regulator UvrY
VKIRVFITDDHAVVRKGLRQILEEGKDIEVCGEAADYGGLVAGLRAHPCDVLVIDVAMPGKNGIDSLKQVLQDYPKLKALVVSMYPEDQFALRALKAGAAGYLTKTSGPERLVEAVRTLAAGRRYLTPEVAQTMAKSLGAEGGAAHEELSDREFQVLRLIAGGRKLAEIAAELSLSAKTVSVYRARLMEKLGTKTNADLTRYAIEHRLID